MYKRPNLYCARISQKDQSYYLSKINLGQASFELYDKQEVVYKYWCEDDNEELAYLVKDFSPLPDDVNTAKELRYLLFFACSGYFVVADSNSALDEECHSEYELLGNAEKRVSTILTYYAPKGSPKYLISQKVKDAYNTASPKYRCVNDFSAHLWLVNKDGDYAPFVYDGYSFEPTLNEISEGKSPLQLDPNDQLELNARHKAEQEAEWWIIYFSKDDVYKSLTKLAKRTTSYRDSARLDRYQQVLKQLIEDEEKKAKQSESHDGYNELMLVRIRLVGFLSSLVNEIPDLLDIAYELIDLIGNEMYYGLDHDNRLVLATDSAGIRNS